MHSLCISAVICFVWGLAGCHPFSSASSSGSSSGSRVSTRFPAPSAAASSSSFVSSLEKPLFEDVTERAGLTFRHTNGESKRPLFAESVGGGCAFLDVDGDGLLDILLLSCGRFSEKSPAKSRNLSLYHNNGDGTFTNITQGSGLDIPLGYAQGIAVGDYDNDGKPDIFIAGYGGCHLFHNETISASARSPHRSTSSAVSSRHRVFFRDVTASSGMADNEHGARWATGAVWGDYDNDGRLDLYLIHYCVWSPETDRVCTRADGTPGYCSPVAYEPDSGRLFHNEGNGHFRDVTQRAGLASLRGRGLAATWLDYDDDGKLDLYIANDLNPNQLLHNRGDGTFIEVGTQAGVALGESGQSISGMGIAPGDYDHTGRESLFVTALNNQTFSLYHNEGGGLFSYATDRAGLADATRQHSGWGVAFVDFDRDGWLDLVSGNGNVHPLVASDLGAPYAELKGVYRNRGNGAFEDLTAHGGLRLPHATRGLAVGDFDNDGRIDVLCVNRDDRAELLHNVSPDTNHWVSLHLIGTRSNRDGAGAKVRVTAGNMRQFAECRLGASYASSSDKRLFFGLGSGNKPRNGSAEANQTPFLIDLLEIRWPSGQHDFYRNVPADHFYAVTEGKGYRNEYSP